MFWVRDIIDTASDCDHFETIGLVQWKVIVTRLGFGTSKKQIFTQDGVCFNDLGNYKLWQSVKGGFCVCSEVSEERVASSGGSGWPCKVCMCIVRMCRGYM